MTHRHEAQDRAQMQSTFRHLPARKLFSRSCQKC